MPGSTPTAADGSKVSSATPSVGSTHRSPESLSPGAFSAQVTAITSAFGDPTRRQIYLVAHESIDGVTASEIAARFGLHPNVARHHLEKLTAGGYLEVAGPRPGAAGAGRPSKHYRSSPDRPQLDVSVRTDDLVLALLGRALAALPADTAQAIAEDVGVEYGRAMASGMGTVADPVVGQKSLRSALHAVADALTAHGFAAHTESRNDQLRIVNNHCPFGDVAIEHPVICAVDRGMVKGMLTAIYGDTEPSTQESLPHGDTFCATAV